MRKWLYLLILFYYSVCLPGVCWDDSTGNDYDDNINDDLREAFQAVAPYLLYLPMPIEQDRLTMIEDLLKDANPQLIPKIGKSDCDMYGAIISRSISQRLKQEIEECLGQNVFAKKEKLQ